MTTEDFVKFGPFWEVPAGEDLSAQPPGLLVTLDADFRAIKWNPTYDTEHLLAVCTNAPALYGPALLALPGQIVFVNCLSGCDAQDRMMPCSGFDIGWVDPWVATNVTCGFALVKADPGFTIPMFLHYEMV